MEGRKLPGRLPGVMNRRDWMIAGSLAVVLMLLMRPLATLVLAVLLGYWVYRDAKARRAHTHGGQG